MAKRIIWSKQAERFFNEILAYYIDRNGSKTYSRKLNEEILHLISLISKQPFIGIQTENKDIRVFIKGNYKIFYQIDNDNLVVHLVWDNRQNEKSITDKFIP